MKTQVTRDNFKNLVLESEKPCFVRFGHHGCPLCVNVGPVISRLEEKYSEAINFFLVDTTDNLDIVGEYLDGGVPTIGIFNDGMFTLIPYPDEPNFFTGYEEEELDKFCFYYLLSLEMRKLTEKGKKDDYQKKI